MGMISNSNLSLKSTTEHHNSFDKDLCSDLIIEVLTRTSSVQTLDTCKAVSKEWNHLINESTFLPLYCGRTNNLSGYFIQGLKYSKYVSMFVSLNDIINVCMKSLPHNMRILASCNQGLLCCLRYTGRKYYRYYVAKPATGQWQPLPNPKLRYETTGIAIIVLRSSPLHYKIVRLSRHKNVVDYDYYKYRCEIFDSDEWRWRETQELKLPCDNLILDFNTAVFVSATDSVNWLTCDDNVLSFDQSKETFVKFSLPALNYNSCYKSKKKLVEYNGRLGLTFLNDDGNMELWLRDEDESNGWSKKMVVDIECVERSIKYPRPLGFYNSEITILKGFYDVVFYNIKSCNVSRVKGVEYELTYADEVFQFRSDLETVDLRGGRR